LHRYDRVNSRYVVAELARIPSLKDGDKVVAKTTEAETVVPHQYWQVVKCVSQVGRFLRLSRPSEDTYMQKRVHHQTAQGLSLCIRW
jgi:hypothetical protein